MKNNKFFLFLIPIIFNIICCKKNDYDLLYEWGKNNSVYISDKIAMNYTNENNKKYYVKEEIEENEIIISLPKSIILDIESALKLSGPKIKKQYQKYKNQKFDNLLKGGKEMQSFRIDQSFLAYIMTIANKNKSPKNKFYQFYKYFFNTFETNLDKFPIFYTSEQINPLMTSIFGNEIIQIKDMFEEEHVILQREIHKKTIDQDEYFKYRIFTYSKFINLTQIGSIVPFIDMLDTNPFNFNLEIKYSGDNNSVSIISTKNIKPGDKLAVAVVEIPNSISLITNGKVFKEARNYIDNFRIVKVSPLFIKEKNLDFMLSDGETIDLKERNYYEKIVPTYMELSRLLKEDGSRGSALRLFLENIKIIRKSYDKVTFSVLQKLFFNTEYAYDIKIILDTEKSFLDKKIKEMENLVNKYGKQHDL